MSDVRIEYSGEFIKKFVFFINFYNRFSREFIVQAKGMKCQQMNGKITVKNLSTSSLNLTFLVKILDKIADRLVAQADVSNNLITEEFNSIRRDLLNHISEIFATITKILHDMFGNHTV